MCHDTCLKKLTCGHNCQSKCHNGPCEDCKISVKTMCDCGKKEIQIICSSQKRKCDSICRTVKSCGKHSCSKKCCTESHYCLQACQRTLSCGKHRCLNDCGHPGLCHSCVEGVSFDESKCFCGASVKFPPIACGDTPPECLLQCTRSLRCGHPNQTVHYCHLDDNCPPCMQMIPRQCECGKTTQSIPCFSNQVPKCSIPCGKTLTCGHVCRKPCHNLECPKVDHKCSYTRTCGHVCQYPCHSTSYDDNKCSEDRMCRQTCVWRCTCGVRSLVRSCGSLSGTIKQRLLACDFKCQEAAMLKTLSIDEQLELVRTLWSRDVVLLGMKYQNKVNEIEQILNGLVKAPKCYNFPDNQPKYFNKLVIEMCHVYGFEANLVDLHWKKPSVSIFGYSFAKFPQISLSTVISNSPQFLSTVSNCPIAQSNSLYLTLPGTLIDAKNAIQFMIRQVICEKDKAILVWMDDYECIVFFDIPQNRLDDNSMQEASSVDFTTSTSNSSVKLDILQSESPDLLNLATESSQLDLNNETKEIFKKSEEKLMPICESIERVFISQSGTIIFRDKSKNKSIKNQNKKSFRISSEWESKVKSWKKLGIWL